MYLCHGDLLAFDCLNNLLFPILRQFSFQTILLEFYLLSSITSDKTLSVWNIEGNAVKPLFDLGGQGFNSAHYNHEGSWIITAGVDGTTKILDAYSGNVLKSFPNIPGLFLGGCSLRNLHPESNLSEEDITLLRQYGGIFTDEDQKDWEELMKIK